VAAWIAGIASGLWFKGAEGTLSGQEARLR